MNLGLLADLHEEVGWLTRALALFREQEVEQVVVLGDVADRGTELEETVRLLAEAQAVGVWGNHDLGLCLDPDESLRRAYSPAVFDFMATLRPRFEVEECHFTHVEPWLDTEDPLQLWHFEGPPETPEQLSRSFAAVPHRHLFVGHFHRWLAATPAGLLPWHGERPLTLSPGRFLISLAALAHGSCATFDTRTTELRPWNLRQPEAT